MFQRQRLLQSDIFVLSHCDCWFAKLFTGASWLPQSTENLFPVISNWRKSVSFCIITLSFADEGKGMQQRTEILRSSGALILLFPATRRLTSWPAGKSDSRTAVIGSSRAISDRREEAVETDTWCDTQTHTNDGIGITNRRGNQNPA